MLLNLSFGNSKVHAAQIFIVQGTPMRLEMWDLREAVSVEVEGIQGAGSQIGFCGLIN
jgi:hypothetical protein